MHINNNIKKEKKNNSNYIIDTITNIKGVLIKYLLQFYYVFKKVYYEEV